MGLASGQTSSDRHKFSDCPSDFSGLLLQEKSDQGEIMMKTGVQSLNCYRHCCGVTTHFMKRRIMYLANIRVFLK